MARDTAGFDHPASGPAAQPGLGAGVGAGTDEVEMPTDEAISAEALVLSHGATLGEGLKAAREFLRLDLDEISEVTKIRRQYLQALEDTNLGQLPSRPFIEGYIRAYARLLGVDEGRAVARFRRDAPDPESGQLREPIGVSDARDPRIAVVVTAGALVLVAIVIWNIAQRAMADRAPAPSSAIVAAAPLPAQTPGSSVTLGDSLPPPVEATLPPAYVTPGLAPVDPAAPAAAPTGPILATNEPPRAFSPRGPVYGAPAEQSTVTLQAVRNVLLVVKGEDDKVYTAQTLEAGEAYRLPNVPGLIVDVSVPSSMEVFVAGQYLGQLTQPLTKASVLVP
jgi:cytoskeleton protein RodZ